jgi:hypothetical protein
MNKHNHSFIEKVVSEIDLLLDWLISRKSVNFHDVHYAAHHIWVHFRLPGSYVIDHMMRRRGLKFRLNHEMLEVMPRGGDTPHVAPSKLKDLAFSKNLSIPSADNFFVPLFTLGDWPSLLAKNVVWADSLDSTFPLILYYGNLTDLPGIHKHNGLITFPAVCEVDGELRVLLKHMSSIFFTDMCRTLDSLDHSPSLEVGKPLIGLRKVDSVFLCIGESQNVVPPSLEDEIDSVYDRFIDYADMLRANMYPYHKNILQSLAFLLISQRMSDECLYNLLCSNISRNNT